MRQLKSSLETILKGLTYSVIFSLSFVTTAQNITETFTTTGNQTWTVPQGVSSVSIHAWGAGGGGGGTESHILNYTRPRAAGGGGGAYSSIQLSVIPGDSYDITVGNGGQGGLGNQDGTAGEFSSVSFESSIIVSAEGGQGGAYRNQDNTGVATGIGGATGVGFLFAGGNGGAVNTTTAGAGGGGAGGTTQEGTDGTATTAGIGGALGGGNGGAPTTALDQNGHAGMIPGGGGSGSARADLAGTSKGGDGARGEVQISYCKLPVLTGITGNITMCEGEVLSYEATLVDNNATSFVWTLPNGWTGSSISDEIVVVAGGQSGTITVVAENECGMSEPFELVITATPLPAQPSIISGNNTVCENDVVTYAVTNDTSIDEYTWTLPSDWTGSSTTNEIQATVASSGNISVVATNGCGTSAPRLLAVTMNTIPASPAEVTGVATICQGETTTYTATSVANATSYIWNLPADWTGSSTSNTITVTVGASTGTVEVSAANGCGVSSEAVINVTVNPIDNTITREGGILKATQAGATYLWMDCVTGSIIDGQTAQTFEPTQNGEYSVLIFTAEGCSATSDCYVLNDLSVKKQVLSTVTIAPNPASSHVVVSNVPLNSSVSLLDMTGKIVANHFAASTTVDIDVRSVNPGVYIVQIASDKGTTTQRLIVK
jgi:hypothetical protein